MEKQNSEDQILLTPEEHARQTRSWQAGDMALVKLSAAMRKAREAKTNRDLARARVAIQEMLIRGMIADGAPWGMVLEHLEKAMPEIPVGELFNALEALRKRMLRERQKLGLTGLNNSPSGAGEPSNGVFYGPTRTGMSGIKSPNLNPVNNSRADDLTIATTKNAQIASQKNIPREANLGGEPDRQPGESDAEYQLRKSLEPDPKGRQKFIGEH